MKDKYGTDVRVLPAGNDVARLAPLRAKRAAMSAMGSGTYFAQEGVFEFGVKEWGPQALQMTLSTVDCNGLSVGVTKDSGVKEWKDFKGKRLGFVVGSPALNQNALAIIAYGGLTQKDVKIESPTTRDLYRVGTIARILKLLKMPDGSTTAILQGRKRFYLDEMISEDPYMIGKASTLEYEQPKNKLEFRALISSVRDAFVASVRCSRPYAIRAGVSSPIPLRATTAARACAPCRGSPPSAKPPKGTSRSAAPPTWRCATWRNASVSPWAAHHASATWPRR